MSEEIEKIVVGPDSITVHGRRKPSMCQCGHAKSFHFMGRSTCLKLVLHPRLSFYLVCECSHFVDVEGEPPRSWPAWLPWLIFVLSTATFFTGVLVGRLTR